MASHTVADQARHNEVTRGYIHRMIKEGRFPKPDDTIGPRKMRVWRRLHKIKRRGAK
jgi:hypothetical protein